jgi:hypothetical protein
VCEERVGKAVPGLAHRVGAEWRGAHVGKQPHRSNALDGVRVAAALKAAHARVVWQCHCHGLGLISLRAARVRVSDCIFAVRGERRDFRGFDRTPYKVLLTSRM